MKLFITSPMPFYSVLLSAVLVTVAGCEKAMQDMYNQPKNKTYSASEFFPDGLSARPKVKGTVIHANGTLAGSSSGRNEVVGLDMGPIPDNNPLPITPALLQRGRQRFDIYCEPCHGLTGDGDGLLPRRGFPHPPTYHSQRLRDAPDSHFYQVITDGIGVMYPYADRVPPDDRWAIIAYMRALQLSQNASLQDVPPEQQKMLQHYKESRP